MQILTSGREARSNNASRQTEARTSKEPDSPDTGNYEVQDRVEIATGKDRITPGKRFLYAAAATAVGSVGSAVPLLGTFVSGAAANFSAPGPHGGLSPGVVLGASSALANLATSAALLFESPWLLAIPGVLGGAAWGAAVYSGEVDGHLLYWKDELTR